LLNFAGKTNPANGQPTAYRLMPNTRGAPQPLLLADAASAVSKRGEWATASLWVTPYDARERYPAGALQPAKLVDSLPHHWTCGTTFDQLILKHVQLSMIPVIEHMKVKQYCLSTASHMFLLQVSFPHRAWLTIQSGHSRACSSGRRQTAAWLTPTLCCGTALAWRTFQELRTSPSCQSRSQVSL
jgi:hypothetical protein